MNPVTLFGIAYILVPAVLVFHTNTPKPLESRVEPVIIEVGTSVPFGPEKPAEVIVEAAEPIKERSVDDIIAEVFPNDTRMALAVFTAESHLNVRSKGWNCRYDGVSKACRPADRDQAWSVDCGVAQINVKGQECPEDLFNPKFNLEVAKEKFDRRGWQPWSVYNNGSYKKYLK